MMGYEKRKRKLGSEQAGTTDLQPVFAGKHKFLNPYLSDADKAQLEDNADAQYERIIDLIESIHAEYSLRVAFDRHSSRYNATLTCLVDGHANTGFILSIRGATAADALYALHYLHCIKSEGLWRSITPESAATSRFG